jgi:hypothetical protein
LRYFLRELIDCDYAHLPQLAPSEAMFKAYRSTHDWERLQREFTRLLDERKIPDSLDRALFENGPVCLLCSEHRPETCHRSLVAARLTDAWPDVEVRHLM